MYLTLDVLTSETHASMMSNMRTTLTLDDDLAGLLKQRARELGVPFKEISEQYNVIHATQGLTRAQVELMNFAYAPTVEAAIEQVLKSVPRADVTILPSGGTIIPVVSH